MNNKKMKRLNGDDLIKIFKEYAFNIQNLKRNASGKSTGKSAVRPPRNKISGK